MATAAELRTQTLELVRDLAPDAMTGAEAAEAVAAFATIEKAASAGRMFAAVRVAQTDAWRGQGHPSAADWLAAQAGISVREAHTQLGTAKKADGLPKTKAAMRSGNLSPTQAGAVTDGAAADPDAEDDLLGSAQRDTTATLREKAAKAKAAATDSDARERRIRRERSVRTRTDADGAFCLTLRGPAADGVRLEALLRPHEEQAFAASRRGGQRDTYENRRYDALQSLLAQAARPQCSPETADGSPASAPPARLPGGRNTKVIVRIDHTALARGRTVAGETCDVAGLGPISVATAKSLMADSFLAAVITKGHDVVNVAHLGRGLNARQRTAIEWTGIRCSNVACNHTVAIQIDHRVPYADRPETALPNQDPLCPDCHRRKTHHGWQLEPGTGRRRFVDPATSAPAPATGRAGPASASAPDAGRAGPAPASARAPAPATGRASLSAASVPDAGRAGPDSGAASSGTDPPPRAPA